MAIRANQLTNFKGEPYATIPQVEAKINQMKQEINGSVENVNSNRMAVKPFTWEADTAMTDAVLVEGVNPVVNGIEIQAGSKYIEIPAVVFNVFNAATGVAYGDINYIEGGKTLIVFEDWNNEMFGGEKTFVAYGFVLSNGNPINMLEGSILQ